MPEILQPRSATNMPALRRCAQADRAGHLCERATDSRAVQPRAAFANEERLVEPSRTESVALLCISLKRHPRGILNWNEAGLPELRLSDR